MQVVRRPKRRTKDRSPERPRLSPALEVSACSPGVVGANVIDAVRRLVVFHHTVHQACGRERRLGGSELRTRQVERRECDAPVRRQRHLDRCIESVERVVLGADVRVRQRHAGGSLQDILRVTVDAVVVEAERRAPGFDIVVDADIGDDIGLFREAPRLQGLGVGQLRFDECRVGPERQVRHVEHAQRHAAIQFQTIGLAIAGIAQFGNPAGGLAGVAVGQPALKLVFEGSGEDVGGQDAEPIVEVIIRTDICAPDFFRIGFGIAACIGICGRVRAGTNRRRQVAQVGPAHRACDTGAQIEIGNDRISILQRRIEIGVVTIGRQPRVGACRHDAVLETEACGQLVRAQQRGAVAEIGVIDVFGNVVSAGAVGSAAVIFRACQAVEARARFGRVPIPVRHQLAARRETIEVDRVERIARRRSGQRAG